VGGRLTDPAWLVNADPVQVLAALDDAADRDEVLAAAVYRASAHLHRDADAGVRRQLLALDAARYGHRDLSVRITGVRVEDELAEWGAWSGPLAAWSIADSGTPSPATGMGWTRWRRRWWRAVRSPSPAVGTGRCECGT
jgi:hypothetical protein